MREKALLVGIDFPNSEYSITYSMTELKNLAHSCEIDVVEIMTQKLDTVNPKYYVGSGKVAEIKMTVTSLEIDLVIFDDELSPSQIRNLEKDLDVKVIDRSLLILQIFAARANTTEAMLEVELAQLHYLLPRLVGLSSSLSRQGGSSGSFSAKGPGEKKIELDRRKILEDITFIEGKLAKIKQQRQVQKQRRTKAEIPLVALVGYTNAGKSSTMNSILSITKAEEEKQVLAEDKLFATLGTTTRRVRLANHQEFLLLDTVGFVSKLPHHLVKSFRSTLEEILDASLIIHVIDVSSPYYQSQLEVTERVLQEIGADQIPKLYLLNKVDQVQDNYHVPVTDGETIFFSNYTKHNLDRLLDIISEKTRDIFYKRVSVFLPLTEGKLLSIIEGKAIIEGKIYQDNGIYYDCYIPNNMIDMFSSYYVK